jgi:hypothetical protein
MSSFLADPASPSYTTKIHPALTSLADEFCATVARLFAYVGTLALVAILGVHGWDQLRAIELDMPGEAPSWSVADHSFPAFAISQPDHSEKSGTYAILRHPSGGRKDVFQWSDREKPVAELEIYRLGDEFDPVQPAGADIGPRMGLKPGSRLEAAGMIESKFGPVALLHPAVGNNGAGACLGFLKSIADPGVRISGFSCQGDSLPARRAAIGCMLDRLMLLTSGNMPKLAELFARAELKRASCMTDGLSTASADWVTTPENPRLRGSF